MLIYILSVYLIIIALALILLPQLMIINIWPYALTIILLGILGVSIFQINQPQKSLHCTIATYVTAHKSLLVALGYSLCVCFIGSVCMALWGMP